MLERFKGERNCLLVLNQSYKNYEYFGVHFWLLSFSEHQAQFSTKIRKVKIISKPLH